MSSSARSVISQAGPKWGLSSGHLHGTAGRGVIRIVIVTVIGGGPLLKREEEEDAALVRHGSHMLVRTPSLHALPAATAAAASASARRQRLSLAVSPPLPLSL